MESFELKIAIEARPEAIFAAVTEPKWIVKWDTAVWVLNDMCRAGKLRKRDEDGFLTEGEIVKFERSKRFAYLWPVAVDPDDNEEETFTARIEFTIDDRGGKCLMILAGTGFPTVELAEREKNTWGGYYLEKIKKVAETIPIALLEPSGPSRADEAKTRQGHVRQTERATQFE